MYLSLGISLSRLFVNASELFCSELLETFVNFFLPSYNLARVADVAKFSYHRVFDRTASAILLPAKLPVASAAFGIALLYYYINLSSTIISCLSFGDTYLSLAISCKYSFVIVSELFCDKVFKTSVVLSAILLPIKSLVASAGF